jgi:hypothetical protein
MLESGHGKHEMPSLSETYPYQAESCETRMGQILLNLMQERRAEEGRSADVRSLRGGDVS